MRACGICGVERRELNESVQVPGLLCLACYLGEIDWLRSAEEVCEEE